MEKKTSENTDYRKVLIELFEKVELSYPRTLVLTARPDDGTGLKLCSHLEEQASLALGSIYGRTVYEVRAWMVPERRTVFKRKGVNLVTYVTAAFGSVTIAKNAYEEIKKLLA